MNLPELKRLAEAATQHLDGHDLTADPYGLQVWGRSRKDGLAHVVDIRGWGYLTGGGHGALSLGEEEGIAAQKAVQAYLVAAWNNLPALISRIEEMEGALGASRQQAIDDVATAMSMLPLTKRQLEDAKSVFRAAITGANKSRQALKTEGA